MGRREDRTATDRPSLGSACARVVGVGCGCAVIIATAAFAIATDRLMARLTAQAVVEQARICAVSLQSSPDGDLRTAVDQLRSRYTPLVGAASVGISGDLQWVGGILPSTRQAASTALADGNGPVEITTSGSGAQETLWAVAVALNGTEVPSARHVLFLFRRESDARPIRSATAGFGCVILIGFLVGLMSFRGWLARRLVRPLASLAQPISTTTASRVPNIAFETGGWRETQEIAESLWRLTCGLAGCEATIRRIRDDSENRLRVRERGFNRRLRRAEDRAAIDPLTGLRNRTYLDATLPHIVATQQERKEDLSVIMIDMDNFKHLNDTRGHQAGDELLRCTGELLQATIRPTDHAIRYGGDEFLLLLPGVGAQQAQQITQRILKLFAQSAALIDLSKSVTLSAGIASREGDRCADGWQLIAKADAALYNAKRGGKNAVALSVTG